MLNSLPIRIIWHSFSWLTRLTVIFSAAVAVLIALAIILLRYWLLPDIEQYRDKIAASFSEAIGNTVTIGKIEGDWQGLHPHLNFTDVRILDEQRQPALVLNRMDSIVSWRSLFSAELRLSSLDINRPELLIRRDAEGKFFLGNVALSKQGGDNNLAEWLLHQTHIAVQDALIVWVDEQRDASPLVLQQVNLHIDNLLNQHRFALRALPPEYLATPMDVRGDFHGASFDDLSKWHGQVYTQLDYTDVIAWRHWLDLPRELSLGSGAVRSWLSVEAGSVKGIIADLALYNVVAKLAEDAPQMVLSSLRCRATWKDVAGGFEVSVKNLAMRLHDGAEVQSTDAYFRTTKAINNQPATSEVRANLLQLEWLADLASYLPLDADMRTRLEAYSPKGRVANLNVQWQGMLGKPDSYKIKGQFEDIALSQVGAMPGFSGLSLDVDGSDTSGKLNINSHQLVVNAPGVMREPLSFTILIGQAGWQREHNELKITLDNASVVNDDLAGGLYGSYQTQAGTLGVLDLNASLTRGDVSKAARYIPLVALNKEGNDWLNGALLAGHTEDTRIRIKGNLSDFPLVEGTKNILLEIGGNARDVVMEFDKSWPRIENIAGEFWIRGKRLDVKSPSATIMDAALQNVTVALPDMSSEDLQLEITGEASAEGSTFLQFIQQSPVRGYLDGLTDDMRISGNGHLDLFMQIPLLGDKQVKVSGAFRVQDSEVYLGKGVPLLHKTRGELSFTESGMQASSLTAEILGGAASINMQTVENGAVHATVQGHSRVDALRKAYPQPFLNYLQGGAAWNADILVAKKLVQLEINSNLLGIGSSLPQPFVKDADKAMPLRVKQKNISDIQDLITVQLGSLFNARLDRRDKNGTMVIKRGAVDFGAQDKLAATAKTKKYPSGAKLPMGSFRSKNGIWLAGGLPELSIEGWDNLISGVTKASPTLHIAGVNLYIEKLTGYGQIIKSLRMDSTKRGDGLALHLASDALNGEVIWLPHGYEKGGKFNVHLRNLYWVKDEQPQALPSAQPGKPVLPEIAGKTAVIRPGMLPALEIVIENLRVKDNQFGRFELVGHPDGEDWRLRRLNITNSDGSLAGDGVWRSVQENMQTQLNLQLKLSDVGKTLARYSYPNTIKGGSGKLAANLSWSGTPGEFNNASLNGALSLDTGKGRFLKMEPGAGKLLSILSLQALPSHITLDFTDVFSEGFQFDHIKGNAAIKNGILNTQDLYMDGSAAKVTMKGSVDLNSGTQDLLVRVLPTIGDSVSLISAFAAGPAVGVGTLIVNKILGDPLDKLVSFEYNISGTWSEPNVVKVAKEPVPYK